MTGRKYDPDLLKSAYVALLQAIGMLLQFLAEDEDIEVDGVPDFAEHQRLSKLYNLHFARQQLQQANKYIMSIPDYMNDLWLREARLQLIRIDRETLHFRFPMPPQFGKHTQPEEFKNFVQFAAPFCSELLRQIKEMRDKIELLWRDASGMDSMGFTPEQVIEMLREKVEGLNLHAATMRVRRNTGNHLEIVDGEYDSASVEKFLSRQNHVQKRTNPYDPKNFTSEL